VAKLPYPDACGACLAAYTTDGVTPRVFTLDELRANGSNAGRKAAERRPTLEAFHPRCTCEVCEVPTGYDFTPGTQQLARIGEGERTGGGEGEGATDQGGAE
jgi:hypothetical protein